MLKLIQKSIMRKKFLLVILFLSGFYTLIYSQDDIQIGSPSSDRMRATGAVYDYSDPNGINIKVQLWGYVRYPGYYIVPAGISINELMSFAGGPTEDATLDDVRVAKLKEGSQTVMEKYSYDDLMWKDDIKNPIKFVRLEAGDVVVVPGKPRYFVREDISFYLSVITAVASLWALIFTLTRD
jgi:polysaccharide biosynthesis/export protein